MSAFNKFKITFESDWPIINILNEVCNGFTIKNFEGKFGCNEITVKLLLDRLSKEFKTDTSHLYLTDAEAAIIKKALEEVEKEIEEWEFGLRIGASLEEVKNIPIFKE